jgi:hypothetical protein
MNLFLQPLHPRYQSRGIVLKAHRANLFECHVVIASHHIRMCALLNIFFSSAASSVACLQLSPMHARPIQCMACQHEGVAVANAIFIQR